MTKKMMVNEVMLSRGKFPAVKEKSLLKEPLE